MTEKFLQTDNGKVFYWCSDSWNNEKQTIFFLHGLTADHTMFMHQFEYFKNQYNIIMWDAPAHGKSRPYANFDFNATSNAVKGILQAENVSSAIFAGQSLGGLITQGVIKRFPELVSAFIAIDSCPYGQNFYSKSDIYWLKKVEPLAKWYSLKMLKNAMAKQVAVAKETHDNMMSMLEPYDKNELCHLMGIGYAGFLDDNCELEIKCPTLLIVGDHDKTGKVKSYCKQWTKDTGFPLVTIKNAAHNSNVDQPEQVNEAIEKFLKS